MPKFNKFLSLFPGFMFEFGCKVGKQAKNIRKFKELKVKIDLKTENCCRLKIFEICD